jgi:hypothetical protein
MYQNLFNLRIVLQLLRAHVEVCEPNPPPDRRNQLANRRRSRAVASLHANKNRTTRSAQPDVGACDGAVARD